MKTQIFYLISALLITLSSALKAQDWPEEYLGLPGDNLNLYAVMNLFQQSETLEGFERELNKQDHMVNNLDLNRDGYVDYIMVFNYVQDNTHHIVLRVALNEHEMQDVAVFIVEKLRTGAVHVQLIGDEALYGPNYIIEPAYAETPNPGYTGVVAEQKVKKRRNVTVVRTTYYEVASWPVIVYIYRPSYVVWRSPWRWSYYPVYWSPWTPHYWHFYYGYHYNWHAHYYAHFRPCRHPRSVHHHRFYHTSIRNYSPTVVVNINKGEYKNTYSRPETRREGEVLFTQRRSTGSNIPQGRESAANRESRQEHRATPEVNARAPRPSNDGVSATNGRENRQIAEPSRGRTEKVSPGRNERSTEVSRKGNERRETTASPQRTETRSTREQVQAPAREQNVRSERQSGRTNESRVSERSSGETPAPSARNVERPSNESRRSSATSAPSVSGSENRRASSVQQSQPSRSETRSSSNVKATEKNTRSGSAAKEVKREESETRQTSREAGRSNTRGRGR